MNGHDECADNDLSHNNSDVSTPLTSSCDSALRNDSNVHLKNGKVPKFQSKGISFGHLNINSLVSKIDEFRLLCNNAFDVICVNETKCDDTVHDNELNLPGFNLLRRDRKRDGGVALYVRDCFNFQRRDDLCDKSVECIWIELNQPKRKPIFICALYNPNGKDVEFSDKLLNMLSNVPVNHDEIILLGDHNLDFFTKFKLIKRS